MPKIAQPGVAFSERSAMELSSRPSWDDLRVLVTCASSKSFRQAGKNLKLSPSTVLRRIERLEQVLNVKLFNRLPEGIILTQDGEIIAASAKPMESALFEVMRRRDIAATQRSKISISVTEGLGTYWIVPQLARFQRQHPELLINMRCSMSGADVLRLEADLSIQFIRPTSSDLLMMKLGKLNIFPYASAEYLRIYGVPSSAEDLKRHRIVNQIAPQVDHSVWDRFLGMESVEPLVSIAANTSTAVLYAIEAGAGIGALPTYVGAINRAIIPVEVSFRNHFDIFLVYHPDVRKSKEKMRVVDWIRDIFDAKKHPYFSDEFIVPPDERLVAPFRSTVPAPHPLTRW